jgi:hypothetical protein
MSNRPNGTPESGHEYPTGWAPGELPKQSRVPGSVARWVLGALAVVTVVAVGAVLMFTGDEPRSSASSDRGAGSATSAARSANAAPGTVASAKDNGPVEIITEDDTCGVWDNVQTAISVARNSGWDDRDPWVQSSTWTPDQRAQFEAVGDALRTGADTAVKLVAQTPHRTMRELYEAFIVYGRGYSDGLLNYQPMDDYLAQTSIAAADTITHICAANRSKVTGVQAPKLAPVPPPSTAPVVGDPTEPKRFLSQPNPSCAEWTTNETALRDQLQTWSALDPNIAVGQLDKEQVLTYADAARTANAFADTMEAGGRSSGNPAVEDFATLGALYFRAYAQAVPLIWAGDHDMAEVGLAINRLVTAGCQATGI